MTVALGVCIVVANPVAVPLPTRSFINATIKGRPLVLYKLRPNGDLKPVTEIPHKDQYDVWAAKLEDEEFDAVYDELLERLDSSEFETSSWIPGSDWSGTVFEPLLATACNGDTKAAALFFGLILWQVVMEHPASWSFGRYELDETPIEGMTYFRIEVNV